MIKKYTDTILLILVALLLIFIALRNENMYDQSDMLWEKDQKIQELRDFRDTLILENADLKTQRLTINELEHEMEMFFDSSYVDNNTSSDVKDSVVSAFIERYHLLVGQ